MRMVSISKEIIKIKICFYLIMSEPNLLNGYLIRISLTIFYIYKNETGLGKINYPIGLFWCFKSLFLRKKIKFERSIKTKLHYEISSIKEHKKSEMPENEKF